MRQEPSAHDVTVLLRPRSDKNKEALDEMTPMVYKELPFIAKRLLACVRRGHLLQTTPLMNEAYFCLVEVHQVDWQDGGHSLAICARAVGRILADYARFRRSVKRGAGQVSLEIEEGLAAKVSPDANFLEDDDALKPWRKSTLERAKLPDCAFLMV